MSESHNVENVTPHGLPRYSCRLLNREFHPDEGGAWVPTWEVSAMTEQAETAILALLEVVEHGSNSGPVFNARVQAYAFLRRAQP